MLQHRIFCVKLQLHFGGDFHEIAVPAYDGAEPTVLDLMVIIERDFRVPRVLQHLIFHGQELHPHPNDPLSRFGIKNLATVRLVGRMAPADLIPQINAQYQKPTDITDSSTASNLSIQQDSIEKTNSVATQYEPPIDFDESLQIILPERMVSPRGDGEGEVSQRSSTNGTNSTTSALESNR